MSARSGLISVRVHISASSPRAFTRGLLRARRHLQCHFRCAHTLPLKLRDALAALKQRPRK